MFNAQPRINVQWIDDKSPVVIIDDALQEPQRWVDLALEHRQAFAAPIHNAYPGLELRMPDGISQALDEFFASHARSFLRARRTLRSYSRLAMVTLPPEQLTPRQWICHRDRMELEPGRCVAASVLYLFRDEGLGGTRFFRPLRNAGETARLVHDSGQVDGETFTRRYAINPGYPADSNPWFEVCATIPPRWNRLIFYDGMQFHCAHLPAPQRLSDDPARGRLTLNGFFTCRQSAH